jgi:hypothetical protein
MSQRVLIRHSSGSKASTVEEFPVSPGRELTFGREAACDVRFDPDRDEFVSRRHMKLVVGNSGQPEFTVVELNARNGTFVNRQRIHGSGNLQPGDLVQLGAGGPEFVFEVAAADLKVTPISEVTALHQVREVPPAAPSAPRPGPAATPPPKVSGRPKRTSGRKKLAGVGALAVAVLGAGVYLSGAREGPIAAVGAATSKAMERVRGLFRPDASAGLQEVTRRNAEALVVVENTWRLLDAASGRQLRQIYIPNRRNDSDGDSPLVPGAAANLPVFVLLRNNHLQPLLTVADHGDYRPIGGTLRASGFVFSAQGLVLTTRASTAPWNVPFDWPTTDSAGVVAVFDDTHKLTKTAVIARRQFPQWLPTDTDFVIEEPFDGTAVVPSHRIRGSGRSDSLTVRSSTSGGVARGSVLNASGETNLAVVGMDAAMESRTAAIAMDRLPEIGDEVTAIAPTDARRGTAKLGAILPDGRYALAADPGVGDPGSPLFDHRGRVVGIRIDRDPARPEQVLALPIDRAMESVGRAPSSRR